MDDEKISSVKLGIVEAERESAMAKSKGWDDIADDWTRIKYILGERLATLCEAK